MHVHYSMDISKKYIEINCTVAFCLARLSISSHLKKVKSTSCFNG